MRLCLGDRVDQIARPELRRIKDHRFTGLTKLVDIVALDALVLNVKDARFLPFAERAEFDVADDCLELGLVEIICELALVETADRRNGLSEDLHLRVGERRPKSERVSAGRSCALLIAPED